MQFRASLARSLSLPSQLPRLNARRASASPPQSSRARSADHERAPIGPGVDTRCRRSLRGLHVGRGSESSDSLAATPKTRARRRDSRPALASGDAARVMDPGAPFDQLPADLIHRSRCGAALLWACLTRMECTCGPWRAAIRGPGREEMLWRLVTLDRFPRVEGILKVKPTTKTWREIYRLQRVEGPPAGRARAASRPCAGQVCWPAVQLRGSASWS